MSTDQPATQHDETVDNTTRPADAETGSVKPAVDQVATSDQQAADSGPIAESSSGETPPSSATDESSQIDASVPSPVPDGDARTAADAGAAADTPQSDPLAANATPGADVTEPDATTSPAAERADGQKFGGLWAHRKSQRDDEPSGSAQTDASLAPDETGGDPAANTIPALSRPDPRGPASIPDAEQLDADLEAQISAAMSAASAPADVPEPAQGEAAAAADGEVATGQKVTGVVQTIHGDNVFLDAGMRMSLVVPLRQFESGKHPSVGDTLQVTVDGVDEAEGLITAGLPRGRRRLSGNWDDVTAGQVVDCLVKGTNKGGLDVSISSLRGFLPASQVDLGYVENLGQYVGQKLRVQITEVNPKKRNLIVSRRVLLQAEREAAQEELWKTLEEGQTFTGTVKTIKDYGAFVDVGGVDGFLHIGQISWSRIGHPGDVLAEGQSVDVKVLSLDPEKKRISLGMRQLTQNPWLAATEKYSSGRAVSGRVTRLADYGAFVELEPGIEGLIHVSELAWRRVRTPSDVVQAGQQLDVQVIEVDANRKRVALSLKALQDKPEVEQKPEADQSTQAPGHAQRKKSRQHLKGGTGSNEGGGGLFGNPGDFQ